MDRSLTLHRNGQICFCSCVGEGKQANLGVQQENSIAICNSDDVARQCGDAGRGQEREMRLCRRRGSRTG